MTSNQSFERQAFYARRGGRGPVHLALVHAIASLKTSVSSQTQAPELQFRLLCIKREVSSVRCVDLHARHFLTTTFRLTGPNERSCLPAISFGVPANNWIGNGRYLGYQCLQQRLRVGLPSKIGALSSPKLKKLRLRSFLSKRDEIFYESALQRIRKNLNPWAVEFFNQLVMYSPG